MVQMVKDAELRARQKELDHLKQVEKKSFTSRNRFREREFLQAVYRVWRQWPKDKKRANAERMAKLSEVPSRKSAHSLRIMMDCSSPGTDEKLRSRWTQALRYAHAQNVHSSALLEFLMEGVKGGVAGAARELAKPAVRKGQKRPSSTSNKK
jgi:hypothetical protein